jgi:hypothetical protein
MEILRSYWENGIYHVVVDFDECHGKTYKFDSVKTHEQVMEFATQDFAKFEFIKSTIDNNGE